VNDIAQHYRQWGTRRFWFTDAQFITGKAAYPQCTEIMERINRRAPGDRVVRLHPHVAHHQRVRQAHGPLGVGDLEVAITSGSPEVLNGLHMGFVLDRLYDGCRHLAEAGFQREGDPELLAQSLPMRRKRRCVTPSSRTRGSRRSWPGRVFPMMFLSRHQPHTDLEARLLDEGYLTSVYNPLVLSPSSIRKMLYNPLRSTS